MTKYLDDILLILGAALVTTGAALIYVPAGFISAGIFCLCGGVLYGHFLAISQKGPEA